MDSAVDAMMRPPRQRGRTDRNDPGRAFRPVAPTLDDAIEIPRRHRLGEARHVIAAGFGVDQGRISEVVGGKRFPEAKAIAMTGRSARSLREGCAAGVTIPRRVTPTPGPG